MAFSLLDWRSTPSIELSWILLSLIVFELALVKRIPIWLLEMLFPAMVFSVLVIPPTRIASFALFIMELLRMELWLLLRESSIPCPPLFSILLPLITS
jgi:hypothetical protein